MAMVGMGVVWCWCRCWASGGRARWRAVAWALTRQGRATFLRCLPAAS